MEERNQDLIIGTHSILAALQNPRRRNFHLVGTDKGIKELKGKVDKANTWPTNLKIQTVNPHELQEKAKAIYKDIGLDFQRIPSQVFLTCSPIELESVEWLYQLVTTKKSLKIFCLDQVTDTSNGGAILRTGAFYGIDALILSVKGNFGLTPAFFRMASGATEFVTIVKVPHLPKTLQKLQELNVQCIGLSEHADLEADQFLEQQKEGFEKICLVAGAEDKGISHAVERMLKNLVKFRPMGALQSLNVSVASAIAMEKFFNKNRFGKFS